MWSAYKQLCVLTHDNVEEMDLWCKRPKLQDTVEIFVNVREYDVSLCLHC